MRIHNNTKPKSKSESTETADTTPRNIYGETIRLDDYAQSEKTTAHAQAKPDDRPVAQAPARPRNSRGFGTPKPKQDAPEAPKAEPATPQVAKAEPLKSEPVKSEPAKSEPAKDGRRFGTPRPKTNPAPAAKAEQAVPQPVKSEPAKDGRRFGAGKPKSEVVSSTPVPAETTQTAKTEAPKPGRRFGAGKPKPTPDSVAAPLAAPLATEGVNTQVKEQREPRRRRPSPAPSTVNPAKETASVEAVAAPVKPAQRNDRRSQSSNRSGPPRGMSWNRQKPVVINYTSSNSNDKDIVRIMPLGGIEEIGKNMTAIEYRDEIVIIDCGLKFPEDEMLGIDIVIPDVTFLKQNRQKIKGFFITHGHEDHIGALPYILKELNVPVYATRLTLGLIEIKLREHQIFDIVKLNIVKPRDVIRFGNVSVEFIKTNHSIADACAIAVHTPAGVIVHTGDFKIDLTPVDGDVIDLARFAELGRQGVLALMADSTNVERPGYTHSESTIGANFEKIFLNAKGRIIVATFSSNIHRIQQIAQAAIKLGRKCVFNGRSMENVVAVARELGYLHIDDKHIVAVDDMKRYRPDQLAIMTTGSQGEPMAALSRMAIGEHRKIQIQTGDMVILSSHPIPGNEKSVSHTINLLYKLGAEVIYEAKEDVHVSGHAQQEELKLMQALVKPKYFIPVHGEFRHLKVHSELAQKMGMDPKNIMIPENGDIIELSQKGIRKNGKVQTGQILVDGLGVGDVGSIVLRDRKHLSEDGILTVVVTVDSESGSVIAGPDIISRGFVYIKESEKLLEEVRKIVKNILDDAEGKKLKNVEYVKNQIKDDLKNFLWQRTKRQPMILPVIMEI